MGGGEIPARRIAEQAREAAGLRFRLRSGRTRGPRTESSPEGVDERRREAREQAPTYITTRQQRDITRSVGVELPLHNTRASASQRHTHQGRQAQQLSSTITSLRRGTTSVTTSSDRRLAGHERANLRASDSTESRPDTSRNFCCGSVSPHLVQIATMRPFCSESVGTDCPDKNQHADSGLAC